MTSTESPNTPECYSEPCCLCGASSCPDPRPEFFGATSFLAMESDIGRVWFCDAHWRTKWTKEEADQVRARRRSESLRRPREDAARMLDSAAEKLPASAAGSDAPTRLAPNEAKDSGQLTADPWGIPRAPEPAVDRVAFLRSQIRCNEPGCECPYCIHRAFSPKLGANDPRYNDGKGPGHSSLDASIAEAKRWAEGGYESKVFSTPGWEEP